MEGKKNYNLHCKFCAVSKKLREDKKNNKLKKNISMMSAGKSTHMRELSSQDSFFRQF